MTAQRAAGWVLVALVACTPSSPATEPTRSDARPATRWTVVVDRSGLEAAVAAAHGKPVLLDVTAKWCMPCVQLQAETFTDRRVATVLADHTWIAIDVSDGTDAQLALQEFLGALSLPRVLRYDDGAVLLDALRSGAKTAPAPALEIKTFVDADELLTALGRS